MRPAIRRTTTAALAAAALAFTGCATGGSGTAAEVEDEVITADQVDRTAAVVCVVDPPPGGSFRTARSRAMDFLIGTALVQQYGEEVGAEPTDAQVSNSPQLQQINRTARQLPAEVREDYKTVLRRVVRAQAVLIVSGTQLLQGQGSTQITPEQAGQVGSQDYAAWLQANEPDVDVDPRFGRFEAGALASGDGSLSVAQSSLAKQLLRGEAEVPASQSCADSGTS